MLYYRHWKRLITNIDDVNATEEFVAYSTKGTARKIHPGCKSVLEAIKPQLQSFMVSVCERGIQLMNRMVGREVAGLLPAFKNKSMQSKAVAIHRFTQSMGLTQCASTHTVQKHFTKTEAAAKDFIAMMQVKMQGRNLDGILNMDQMPIPYSHHASKMLEFKGAKTIQAQSSTSDTKLVTLAVAVTVSGKLLPPFLIFKG